MRPLLPVVSPFIQRWLAAPVLIPSSHCVHICRNGDGHRCMLFGLRKSAGDRSSRLHFPRADCRGKGDTLEHATVREVVTGRRGDHWASGRSEARYAPPPASHYAIRVPQCKSRQPRTCRRSLQRKRARHGAGVGGLSRFNSEEALLFCLTGL